MKAPTTAPRDIVSLRMSHCRAEHAARGGQLHLAVMYYRACLEGAEVREDPQATEFFALRLAQCYAEMGLSDKAAHFRALAGSEDAPLLS